MVRTGPEDSNIWYYKPVDMLVINFVVISEEAPNSIRFIDQLGYVFDRMSFEKDTSPHKELIRNGFKEVLDDDFIKLVGYRVNSGFHANAG